MYDLMFSYDEGRTWAYCGSFAGLDDAKDAADHGYGLHDAVAVFYLGREVYRA